jgi:hypothetical protein
MLPEENSASGTYLERDRRECPDGAGGTDHHDRRITMSGRTTHSKPYGRWQHRSRRRRAPEIEHHDAKASGVEHMFGRTHRSDTVGGRHPEHSLEIDFSRACTSWIECVRKVDPRSTFSRTDRRGDQRAGERGPSSGNSPDDLGNGSAREATAQQRVERRDGERKTNACELWRIMRDLGSGRAKAGN